VIKKKKKKKEKKERKKRDTRVLGFFVGTTQVKQQSCQQSSKQ